MKNKNVLMLRICALSLICSCCLTACNTFEGVGKDIQKGGEKIEDAAERNK